MRNDEIVDLKDPEKGEFSREELRNKAMIYLVIMIFASLVFMYFSRLPFDFLLLLATLTSNLVVPLVLASLLELFRAYKAKRKENRKGIKTKRNPIWFEIIESAFSIYLIFFFALLVPIMVRMFFL